MNIMHGERVCAISEMAETVRSRERNWPLNRTLALRVPSLQAASLLRAPAMKVAHAFLSPSAIGEGLGSAGDGMGESGDTP
jgi:hypothetical protein